mgnify:CR=1 FL=1
MDTGCHNEDMRYVYGVLVYWAQLKIAHMLYFPTHTEILDFEKFHY